MKMIEIIKQLEKGKCPSNLDEKVKVYPDSFIQKNADTLLMVKENRKNYLLVSGQGELFNDLYGNKIGPHTKKCETSHENRLVINSHFNHTKPTAFGTEIATIGLGDRLGLASSGHLQLIKRRKIKPIL